MLHIGYISQLNSRSWVVFHSELYNFHIFTFVLKMNEWMDELLIMFVYDKLNKRTKWMRKEWMNEIWRV